ncbi:unnamed protein product [Protopolystoma xenopodis]|uniref:Ran-specific GTPase-activating protein n=1 Tax=Protopolystoma xenopodis TaxID=117903 RepID=A0A448WRJ7_9PLAT|nr:unnamed protein product [Protopolystoma xenopodis]
MAPELPEWKERGTGYLKILKHKITGDYRILMRRDKTLKVCANHYISAEMSLVASCESDRAFVWTAQFDYADEVLKKELFGARFGSSQNAKSFKTIFENGVLHIKTKESCASKADSSETNKLANELQYLKVNELSASAKVSPDKYNTISEQRSEIFNKFSSDISDKKDEHISKDEQNHCESTDEQKACMMLAIIFTCLCLKN